MDGVRSRLAELSAAGLALECSQWLDQLSQQLRQLGGRLLGPCTSGQGLLSVEAAVKAALGEWQYTLQAPADEGAAAVAAVGGEAPGEEPALALSWGDICQWVLGRACPLWPLLFEQPLLERAKQLVSGDFSTVMDEVAALLGSALQVRVFCCLHTAVTMLVRAAVAAVPSCCAAVAAHAQLGNGCRRIRCMQDFCGMTTLHASHVSAEPFAVFLDSACNARLLCLLSNVIAVLQEAASMPPSAPGTAQAGTWSDVFELQPATPDAGAGGRAGGSKRQRLAGQGKSKAGAGQRSSAQGAITQAWLPRAEQLVQRFDQQLSKVLSAALDACGGGQQGAAGAAAVGPDPAGGQQRAQGLAETAASRARVLEPFVQDRCASLRCVLCCCPHCCCLWWGWAEAQVTTCQLAMRGNA